MDLITLHIRFVESSFRKDLFLKVIPLERVQQVALLVAGLAQIESSTHVALFHEGQKLSPMLTLDDVLGGSLFGVLLANIDRTKSSASIVSDSPVNINVSGTTFTVSQSTLALSPSLPQFSFIDCDLEAFQIFLDYARHRHVDPRLSRRSLSISLHFAQQYSVLRLFRILLKQFQLGDPLVSSSLLSMPRPFLLSRVNLALQHLSNVPSLQKANFSHSSLFQCVFSNADLTDAVFDHCDLRGADFTGCTLRRCSFRNADLRGAVFSGAQLDDADFVGADVRKCDFRGTSVANWALVCFGADGSEKFNVMTLRAMMSFMDTTPTVSVGLLYRGENQTKQFFVDKLPEPWKHRVRWLNVDRDRLERWNPTQMKLEIAAFASDQGFDAVYWIDSDTLFYGNFVTPMLRFRNDPNAHVSLVRDLCMHDVDFVQRWRTQFPESSDFVPQACLMGFKKHAWERLFPLWEHWWRRWIFPHPFAQLQDPNPRLPSSAFCTEQYALALALSESSITPNSSLSIFPRLSIVIPTTISSSSRNKMLHTIIQHTPTTHMVTSPITSNTHYISSSYIPMQSIKSVGERNTSTSTDLPVVPPTSIRVDNFHGAVIHTYSVMYNFFVDMWDGVSGGELREVLLGNPNATVVFEV